jgi:hypothetical protein
MVRAGPLSDEKVIDLLNHYFIPVITSNDEYNPNGTASAEEKAARARIAKNSKNVEKVKKVVITPDSNASDIVCYIVHTDGEVHSTLRLPECAAAEKVAEFLKEAIGALHVKPGEQVLPGRPTLIPPKAKQDQMVLHLAARYLAANGRKRPPAAAGAVALDRWMALIANRLRAVCLLPSENWIVLDKPEWSQLMAPAGANQGSSWELSEDLTRKIFVSFYPPSTNNDPKQHRIVDKSLTATLLSVKEGLARVRLEGKVKSKHPFLLFADDDYHVEAEVLGYVDYDLSKHQIKAVKLVSEKGTYAGGNFGIAIWSIQ